MRNSTVDYHVLHAARDQWRKAAECGWWDLVHHDVIPRTRLGEESYEAASFFKKIDVFQKAISEFRSERRVDKAKRKGEQSTAQLKDEMKELKQLYGNATVEGKGGKRRRITKVDEDKLMANMRMCLLPFSSVQVSTGPFKYLLEIPLCPDLLEHLVSQEVYESQHWSEHVHEDYWQFGRHIVLEVQSRLQVALPEARVEFHVESHKSQLLDAETGLSFQIKDEEDVQYDDFHFRLCRSLRPAWILKDVAGCGDLCYFYPACGKWRQHHMQGVLLARCKDALVVAVFIRVLHEKNLTKFWTNSVLFYFRQSRHSRC